MKDIVIIGSTSLNIIKLIEAINADKKTFNIVGFLERDESKIGKELLGYGILGSDDLLLNECKNCGVVVNVFQTPQIHTKAYQNIMNKYGITDFPNIIHPTCDLRDVEIGVGNVIREFTCIESFVKIGNFNQISPFALIGHDTIIGDSNNIAGGTIIGSRAKVGSRNLFSNSCVFSNSYIMGDDNQVGVGAVVLNNIFDGENVLGNPATNTLKVLREHYKGLSTKDLRIRTMKRKMD